MRVDVFLKLSRLVPRRPVAQKMCEAGAVEVNGLRAKSSREVRPGDQITIRQRNRITTVRVLTVPPKPPPKAAAPTLYEIIRAEGTSSVPD